MHPTSGKCFQTLTILTGERADIRLQTSPPPTVAEGSRIRVDKGQGLAREI